MMSADLFSVSSSLKPPPPQQQQHPNPNPNPPPKKKRIPGAPDPDAEVIALSPKTLMATNRFVCEICNKGFQREQNLQLHRRGHNLPWRLKQRSNKEAVKRKVYVCPEITCVRHDPSRALSDLTGIKKHFIRKHGEKKWECERCSKKYGVQSDWKAHFKICGTKEYKCDCGTLFSRKDSFITHRTFCDALAEKSARIANFNFGSNESVLNQRRNSSHGLSAGAGISQIAAGFHLNPLPNSHGLPAAGAGLYPEMMQISNNSPINLFGSSSVGNLGTSSNLSTYSDNNQNQKAAQIGSTENRQATFFGNIIGEAANLGSPSFRSLATTTNSLKADDNLSPSVYVRDFLGTARNEGGRPFLSEELAIVRFLHEVTGHRND